MRPNSRYIDRITTAASPQKNHEDSWLSKQESRSTYILINYTRTLVSFIPS
jgi:hypothetical protein